jgi:hypothetical protein
MGKNPFAISIKSKIINRMPRLAQNDSSDGSGSIHSNPISKTLTTKRTLYSQNSQNLSFPVKVPPEENNAETRPETESHASADVLSQVSIGRKVAKKSGAAKPAKVRRGSELNSRNQRQMSVGLRRRRNTEASSRQQREEQESQPDSREGRKLFAKKSTQPRPLAASTPKPRNHDENDEEDTVVISDESERGNQNGTTAPIVISSNSTSSGPTKRKRKLLEDRLIAPKNAKKRFKSGQCIYALNEIHRLQRLTCNLIPHLPFQRLVSNLIYLIILFEVKLNILRFEILFKRPSIWICVFKVMH